VNKFFPHIVNFSAQFTAEDVSSKPGEDSFTSKLIKYGGRKLWNRIHQLIKIIWET
jgi:hypothetical protein